MIPKTSSELEMMREAGRIVAMVHQKMSEMIKPGITTKELDVAAYKIIKNAGATPSFLNYQGFPASICTSINDVVIHGIPSGRTLQEGDIISIDVGANFHGYHGDSAWTYAVGRISQENQHLLEIGEKCLYEGLKHIRHGTRLTDISHAIQVCFLDNGYSTPLDYSGHGIGKALHEKPAVMNYGLAGRGPILKKGMTLAVEPMIIAGKCQVTTLNDQWSVVTQDGTNSCHFEHTIVVTDDGYEILTKL